ncbi:MAG: zinc-dependent peptidase, partial [Bacteroidota bacterium]|nr:zinc-dependent peptidase [Bacteroidota bacterium]
MNKPKHNVPGKFPTEWRDQLQTHVHFYQNLDQHEKRRFEKKISQFLRQVRITGIKVELTDLDRLLIASSGVIPLFGFPTWNFDYLEEVLLYPAAFDRNFSMDKPEEIITGMVGSSQNMEGVMILSKESLHHGFANTKDKQNTAIHEFVHILDKQDGAIDGVPGVLNDKEYARPWLKLMSREMERIKKGESDIDEYAATTEEEFLAVASEYFFERPKLFQQNH